VGGTEYKIILRASVLVVLRIVGGKLGEGRLATRDLETLHPFLKSSVPLIHCSSFFVQSGSHLLFSKVRSTRGDLYSDREVKALDENHKSQLTSTAFRPIASESLRCLDFHKHND